MDANGNQRKRGGRVAKNVNSNDGISATQNTESNEVMEVSAVAISPTLEVAENATAAPAAECRRSSRKKIIKFDVRDLLNKNRKTHKIQIEARIDSNAPNTSKAAGAAGNDLANAKTAITAREDLLSKQKTFLEKSAIFRRYSISQEPKPPPLPMPPLLGKNNDIKDVGLSSISSARRLSRTQEFFSNVMIKPKQTTSLIVAQIESNTPSTSTASVKRKSLNKSVELETRTMSISETESSKIVPQKKRGRPAKFKAQSFIEAKAIVGGQEEAAKKITPEKAKNWKEYKACLAQQSSSSKKAIESLKTENKEILITSQQNSECKKQQNELLTGLMVNLEETSHSDISKSEDDFSGFQTSKDDISCDSPVLANKSSEVDGNFKETFYKKNIQKEIEKSDSNGEETALMTEKTALAKDPKQFDKCKTDIEKSEQIQEDSTMKETEILTNSKVLDEKLVKDKTEKEYAESVVHAGKKSQDILPLEKTKNQSTDEVEKSQKELELFPKNESEKKIENISQKKFLTDNEKAKQTAFEVVQPQFDSSETEIPPVSKILNSTGPDKTEKGTSNEKQISPKETETKTTGKIKKNEIESEFPSKKESEKKNENTDTDDSIKSKLQNVKTAKECKVFKRNTRKSPEILEKHKAKILTLGNTRGSQTKTEQEKIVDGNILNKIEVDKIEDDITSKEDDKNQTSSSGEQKDIETTDKFVLKQTIRNKRTQLRKEDLRLTPTKSTELLEANKQLEHTKEETTINSQISDEDPECSRELKTPDILSKAAQQFVEECTPQTELTAADILLLTSHTTLSQPSTASETTLKTFSRTSSSSESENASERSSYSSDPSSTSSSSSPRSYKSCDKLRVSLKRISLPKSPSTSSQTSTSEELNFSPKTGVLRKKPPMDKRYKKRLQKKFVEMLENKGSENINDCFQKITKKEKEETKEQIADKQENEEICGGTSEPPKTNMETITETLADQESKQDIYHNPETSKIFDSTEKESANMEIITLKGNNVTDITPKGTRKSLRTRKDHSSDDKEEETDKSRTQTKEELQEKEIEVKEQTQSNVEVITPKEIATEEFVAEKPNENIKEKLSNKNHEIQKATESDQSEENAGNQQKRKSRSIRQKNLKKHQPPVEEEIYKKDDKNETILSTKESDIQEDNNSDKKAQEEEFLKLSNKLKPLEAKDKVVLPAEKQEELSEIVSTKSKIKESQTQPEVAVEVETTSLNEISLSYCKDVASTEITEMETSETSTALTEIGNDDANDHEAEELNLSTSTRSKTRNALVSTKESKIQTENLTNKPRGICSKEEPATCRSKFPNEELTISIEEKSSGLQEKTKKKSPTRGKTNKEEVLAKQIRNPGDLSNDECTISKINENESSEQTRDSSKTETSKEEYSKITLVRGRSKKANILVKEKLPKPVNSSTIYLSEVSSPDASTEIVTDLQVECFKSSLGESISVETQENVITESSPSPSCSIFIDRPSSAKRSTREVCLPIPSTNTVTDSQAESSKTCLDVTLSDEKPEISAKESPQESISSQKDVTDVHAKSLTLEPIVSPITSSNLPISSSVKRKSLRNQKDQKSADPPEISLPKTITDMHAESSKSTLESTSPDKSQETQTREYSQSPTCSSNVSIETTRPSVKRKSLRNQKEEKSTEDSQNSTIESEIPSQVLKNFEEANCQQQNENQTVEEETPKVAKHKGQKSRFKNLYGPDIESETDSSSGNNTPIAEIMQQKFKALDAKQNTDNQIETIQEIEDAKKEDQGGQFVEKLDEIEQTSNTNLLSSHIQNVSIETNTLLDILRTVQSNTEAALKAGKSPINSNKTENENVDESTNKMEILDIAQTSANACESSETKEENASESNKTEIKFTNESTINVDIGKYVKNSQFDSEIKISSSTRTDNESPLTLKCVPLSPARSDSSSPLTLKKLTQSPTRSDSSSPLIFKKVTRRYERRNRRGEDIAHKTLEETFAEIAAQSSKAVLTAKELDINEQQTIDEKSQQEVDDINIVANAEKEQIVDNFEEISKSLIDLGEVTLNVEEEKLENIPQLSKDVEKAPYVEQVVETELKSMEIIVESQENTKVTPARRGRKPKNRSLELPITVAKEECEVKKSPKPKTEITNATAIVEEKLTETESQETFEKIPSEVLITKEDKKLESNSKNPKETANLPTAVTIQTESLTVEDNTDKGHPKEADDLLQTPVEGSLKSLNDANENKSSKKSNKKRDTTKADESTLLDSVTNTDKKDEVRTPPKHAVKKRDTSQTKNETKSGGKKLPKKTKNEEEDDTLTKTPLTNITTTPPPSKRGRKPKSQQPETPQTLISSKKKNKKDSTTDPVEEDFNEDSESLNSSFDKSLDEKLAKKKRQKKLKEAFEAALIDDLEKSKEALETETSFSSFSNFGLTRLNKSPSPTTEQRKSLTSYEMADECVKISCVTPVETEEDPDPLKDIEKFIADGVNLLKKDYKLDEDSVDDVIAPTTNTKTSETLEEPAKSSPEVYNTFETPADTPINTPSVTPPPKSPTSIESHTPDENSGVRRSHRIKLITKTPKALVGRGLVRDKERFSIKDDVETKSHYTLDDHLTDLAEVEAKNAKFLKEMEERLSNFQVIKENEYLCERVISREARKMICDCFLTQEEEERGELGCGEDCLNRLLMIECGPECNVKERCTNKRFQKLLCSPCRVFRTEKKGFGIMADIEILPGEFIMEYVGEVIDTEEFEKRRIAYSQDKNRHYYFMALRSDAIIDATIKGNISRFINHSCDPNAETQKWTVNGELRIGFFSRKSIMPGEEITFNYQYQRYGREAQRCYCEAANCRGWIGQEPTSDEGEQIDDDEYEESEDEEEEEADTSNLLVQDDDEDSDASVADPEEVQKQLEMAAAQAEVELAPLQLMEEKMPNAKSLPEGKSAQDPNKSESEEDSKSIFKKLLSKMAEKVAAKQKQNKREQKMQRKKKSKESSTDLSNKLKFLEDPDIEDEVEFLKECGLKNQSDTLRLSRLMVRAKLVQTRLNLLEILRLGDLPCRRLFLDYHGLRLLHGWMSEDAGNMQIRLALLQTLESLPIANKTVLTDSKVMQVVRNWCGNNSTLSPNEDSSSSNSNSQDVPVPASANFEEGSEMAELQKLALKLITTWEGLPEIFRIPKKERIEQMKEHEREADRQYAANAETQEDNTATDRYRRNRFGRFGSSNAAPISNRFIKPNNGNPHRTTNTTPENNKNLSKAQRREMFAAKVARDEAEKRLAEERREFETKCRFFGLDPKKTRPQDIPFSVNPATGQWFSIERKPITTPPSYAHVQVPVKPKSTDPNDYQLPAVCSTLPPQWKYAITPQGKIYYYHIKHRIPQWEPPSPAQLHQCDLETREDFSECELTTTAGEDSSDDDDDILIGLDAAQLKAYIDRKVEMRRQKRYQRLVDERSISPRREEDRIYNQIEVRKYKENKEKIRKRKEEIRRKRAEALRQTSLNMCTLGSITEAQPNANASKLPTESDEKLGALPIQDYLLSSDEEVDLKAEVNSPLIDKIVEGDKIVDELDALTTKRQLKRPLPPHRDLNEPSTSSSSSASTLGLNPTIARQEYKKRKLEKKEKRKPKEQDAKYRKNKEKFRCEIAGIIVHHLKPYRKETCTVGRIQSNEDFNHLARKLTHFVMIKELKYCESVGQTLVVTESVKSKSREFIKKYMAKYGDVYVKPTNDPDFKEIPFTL